MNGQYLMNRPLSLSYAFKKDTRGERHGTPAERLLAAQVRAGGEQLLGKVSGWLAGWGCLCVPAPLSCTRGCRCLLTSTWLLPSLWPLPHLQKQSKEKRGSRPHTMFATGPQQAPQGGLELEGPSAAMGQSGFAAGMPMPPPPMMPQHMGVPGGWDRERQRKRERQRPWVWLPGALVVVWASQ